MFFVVLLYALFASVFTVSKAGLEYAQPLFLIGTRMTLAGIIMITYKLATNRSEFSFKGKSLWKIFLLALFAIYLTNACEFWGLRYLTSFKTCFIYSLSPFFSALFSYLMLSEKMTVKKWVGLFLGFLGFFPILLNHTSSEEAAGQFFFFSWAELAVVLAALFSVYGWILLGQLVRDDGYSPFMANGLSMLIGGAMALTHSFFVETWDPFPFTEFVPFFECALLLIIISNLISYNLYGWLLKKYSATFISFAGFTTPLFTALFGWFFLQEQVTWPFYVSTAIVFSGLSLFYQEELRSLSIAKATAKA